MSNDPRIFTRASSAAKDSKWSISSVLTSFHSSDEEGAHSGGGSGLEEVGEGTRTWIEDGAFWKRGREVMLNDVKLVDGKVGESIW